jgi:hypothetical protein
MTCSRMAKLSNWIVRSISRISAYCARRNAILRCFAFAFVLNRRPARLESSAHNSRLNPKDFLKAFTAGWPAGVCDLWSRPLCLAASRPAMQPRDTLSRKVSRVVSLGESPPATNLRPAVSTTVSVLSRNCGRRLGVSVHGAWDSGTPRRHDPARGNSPASIALRRKRSTLDL